MLENFFNDTANLGSTDKLAKATKRKYQGQTITDMRQDLVTRAKATITALEGHNGGTFRAPMARSIRNGFTVKVGYGKRNVGFFEGEGDKQVAIIPERNFRWNEVFGAIGYLNRVVDAINSGEFDLLLIDTLTKLQARFQFKPDTAQQPEENDSQLLLRAESSLRLMDSAA